MIRKANLEDLDELIKLYRGSVKKMISKKKYLDSKKLQKRQSDVTPNRGLEAPK